MFHTNNKGFTLIELMMTLGILGIIIVIMSQMLNFNLKLVRQEDMKVEYLQNARIAGKYIVKRVRENNLAAIQYTEQLEERIIRTPDKVVFDTSKRSVIPSTSPLLWYYFKADKYGTGNDYGELRDNNSDTVASYIKNLTIQDMSKEDTAKRYLRVVITAGKYADDDTSTVICIPFKFTTMLPPYKLVTEYLFNNNLLDNTGNSNNGTVGGSGSIGWVMGQEGSAVSLDGNTYIEAPDSPSLDSIKTEMLIDLWCYPMSFPDENEFATLVDKRDNEGAKGGYALEINHNKTVSFLIGRQNELLTSDIPLISGWNHITASYKVGGQISIIINGTPKSAAAAGTEIPDSGEGLRVGSDWKGKNSLFTGYIDKVKIYNTITP